MDNIKIINKIIINKRSYYQVECLIHNLCYIKRTDLFKTQTGCLFCSKEKQITSQCKGVDYFIKKSIEKHANKFNYSLVEYKNSKTKVKIICNSCKNIFLQRPDQHKEGDGCPYCANNKLKTTDIFIEQAHLKHKNYYNYSKFKYINSLSLIHI